MFLGNLGITDCDDLKTDIIIHTYYLVAASSYLLLFKDAIIY